MIYIILLLAIATGITSIKSIQNNTPLISQPLYSNLALQDIARRKIKISMMILAFACLTGIIACGAIIIEWHIAEA